MVCDALGVILATDIKPDTAGVALACGVVSRSFSFGTSVSKLTEYDDDAVGVSETVSIAWLRVVELLGLMPIVERPAEITGDTMELSLVLGTLSGATSPGSPVTKI